MKVNIPNTCIFCENFPCLQEDKEATVGSELKGSYPFRVEEDSFKPCGGDDFISAIVIEEISEPPISPTINAINVVPEKTDKLIYIFKDSNPTNIQYKIDKVTEGEGILRYGVVAMTSAFDPDSSKMDIVVCLEVIVDSEKYNKEQNET